MGLLSDFFIADTSPTPTYRGGEDFSDSDKCQLNDLSPLQGAQFLAVLRGQPYSVELISAFELVTPQDAEEWTMLVPEDMVEKLAAIKADQVPKVAEQFAHATTEELQWSTDDFVPIVTDLSALARRAIATRKTMFLWNSL